MFPVAYVNEEELKSQSYVDEATLAEALVYKNKLFVSRDKCEFCEHELEDFDPYVEVMYNRLIEVALDLVEAVSRVSFVVVNPRNNTVVCVPSGQKLYFIEARGYRVYPLVEEGSIVKENDRLFYVVTRKYEVRVVRSPIKGVVVYVGEIIPSTPQTFVAVIVDEHGVRWLRRSSRC